MTNSDKARIVAIHQPNFLPWLGYFDKIARADVFILMDNVQFPKTGGTWTNRVQILLSGRPDWLTAPVERSFHGVREIREIQIDDAISWRDKALRSIQMSYARAPYFDTVFPLLRELLLEPVQSLSALNVLGIRAIAGRLGLDCGKLVLGSTLDAAGASTDLLISMVRAVGGTAYLCGGGAGGYQEDDKFAAAGIALVYQSFQHPVYEQRKAGDFVPGLSIVDALMYRGFGGTASLLGIRDGA